MLNGSDGTCPLVVWPSSAHGSAIGIGDGKIGSIDLEIEAEFAGRALWRELEIGDELAMVAGDIAPPP
jgi:hypothetical protein